MGDEMTASMMDGMDEQFCKGGGTVMLPGFQVSHDGTPPRPPPLGHGIVPPLHSLAHFRCGRRM